MRKTLAGVALALVGVLALGACGFSGDNGASGTTQLNLLVPIYGDKTKPYWEQLIKSFQDSNPSITVKLETQSWDDIENVVRTKVQSRQAPDILELDASAVGYGKEGLLYRADEIVSPAVLGDIQNTFLDGGKVEGTGYGVPSVASTRALFYNTDLLARAGVTSPPKTWDELLSAASKVSALGDGVSGYGLPLGSEEAQAEMSIWLYGAGGDWSDGDKITVDTPQALAAATFMRTLIDRRATQANPGATDRTPLINAFIQGKIGMIEGLPPVVGQIKAKNPGLKWAVAPSPTKDGTPSTLGVADYFVSFKNDGTKQQAIRAFLDFFYRADNYVTFNNNEGFLPATKSGATSLSDQYLTGFLTTLPNAKFYPSSNPAWKVTQGALKSQAGQIESKDPKSVLAEIQAKADAGAK